MLLHQINTWKSSGKIKICVSIDLGGSGLRGRISNANNDKQFIDIPHITAKSTKDLIDSLTNIQNSMCKTIKTFESCGAAIAVAGPISKGKAVLTNWTGSLNSRTLSKDHLPLILFPTNKTVFMNDLEAGAYGIISADEKKILKKNFVQLWPNESPKGPIISNTRTAVMAMGSGLGVALIVRNQLLKKPFVFPCELGHVQIPTVCLKDPKSKEEYELLQHVSDFYYNGKQMPEFEDITSGRGLRLCYQFFLKKNDNIHKDFNVIDAGKIAKMAHDGDKTAKDALFWCYKMYMRLAKQIATSLQCDSILMALDNQVKDYKFVDSISDSLKEEFYNFIRPDWLSNVRVYSQTKKLNFNILGCDYKAHQLISNSEF